MRTAVGVGTVTFLPPIFISLSMLGFTEALIIWLTVMMLTVVPLSLVVIVVARALRN